MPKTKPAGYMARKDRQERRRQIAKALPGNTLAEIARRFGVTPECVRRAAIEFAPKEKGTRGRLTKSEK